MIKLAIIAAMFVPITISQTETIPFTANVDNKEMVRLENGGCIIGPFKVFNPNTGEMIFSLDAGKHFPSNCN